MHARSAPDLGGRSSFSESERHVQKLKFSQTPIKPPFRTVPRNGVFGQGAFLGWPSVLIVQFLTIGGVTLIPVFSGVRFNVLSAGHSTCKTGLSCVFRKIHRTSYCYYRYRVLGIQWTGKPG